MIYNKFYYDNSGKIVRVKMADGEFFEGELYGYISSEDNELDHESLIVKNAYGVMTELFTDEIANIELGIDQETK